MTQEQADKLGYVLDAINRRLLEQDISFATLLVILEERGVCTREEFFRCKAVEDLRRKAKGEEDK